MPKDDTEPSAQIYRLPPEPQQVANRAGIVHIEPEDRSKGKAHYDVLGRPPATSNTAAE